MNIIAAIIVFGLIVFIHELGHFLLAKKNGVGVIEFSIGMGPRIFSTVRNETRYSIKLLPLGGSCLMVGEDTEDDADNALNKKSVGARISVVLAGPVFNFILAFVLAILLVGNVGYDAPTVSEVADGYPAQQAGLQAGDLIRKINNKKIVTFRDVLMYFHFNPDQTVQLEYERDGQIHSAQMKPVYDEESSSYRIGVKNMEKNTRTGFLGTIRYAIYEVKYTFQMTFKSLAWLVQGKVKPNELSGPVGILSVIGSTVGEAKNVGMAAVVLSLVNISILLSTNLGIMNLLPFPALDGGRILFLLIEGFRGKPLDPKKEGLVHAIGFVCLMAMMVFVFYNDIRKLL
ncbi:putative zinc metalloprotease [Clostridia bacterium]|nr:putative zinc metalloprotease [Clostridia bacterium]